MDVVKQWRQDQPCPNCTTPLLFLKALGGFHKYIRKISPGTPLFEVKRVYMDCWIQILIGDKWLEQSPYPAP